MEILAKIAVGAAFNKRRKQTNRFKNLLFISAVVGNLRIGLALRKKHNSLQDNYFGNQYSISTIENLQMG